MKSQHRDVKKNPFSQNAFEAVLGAVFLDGGIESAKLVVEKLFSKRIALTALEPGLTDYKTRLQELTMQISEPAPIYFVDADGPDHEKSFCAIVEIGTHRFGPTYGASKKKAEQAAASLAYSFFEFEFEEKGEKN